MKCDCPPEGHASKCPNDKVVKLLYPVRWLKTPRGPIERKAHLYQENHGRSLCGRMKIPTGVTFDEMVEVKGGRFVVERCSFCWRLR